MLDINQYQCWISDFYKNRGWYSLNPFIRVNFLSEETGEVAKAVRALEIGIDRPDEQAASPEQLLDNLTEELGDVLDNIFILADKYNITLEQILEQHQKKLQQRFQEVKLSSH
ncbi:MazG nucleotide pyrophosphohydrolase domain-containing protein [Paenibacillus turicensis]|uniref:MazG nucleotide pyrophosphohydrolase domain-containing protein n=1 Tax=Paenibacillus turicensis TaxID=160487 RepID=UPI003D2E7D3C